MFKSKRAVLVAPGKFEIRETEAIALKGQVVVKIASCGLCNWELNHWQGKIGTFPQEIGHEWNGEVVEVGEGVTDLKKGDHIAFCPGEVSTPGFTQYTVAEAGDCFKVDTDYELKYAIAEPLKCIITVLRASKAEAGDYGVIQGAGPMGLWCVSALSGHLLSRLIVVDIDDQKLELARKFGATDVINPTKEDAAERIAEITKGHMADFVIDGTGIPELLQSGIHYLKIGRGRLIMMSSHERAAKTFDFREAVGKAPEIIVAHPPYSKYQKDDMRRAIKLMEKGTFHIDEMLTHVYPLDEIQRAFEELEHKPKGFIKGVVIP